MITDALMEECDICHAKHYRRKTGTPTIQPVMLPVTRYDENGKPDAALDIARLDACENCLRNISSILSQHYEMGIYGNGRIIVKQTEPFDKE